MPNLQVNKRVLKWRPFWNKAYKILQDKYLQDPIFTKRCNLVLIIDRGLKGNKLLAINADTLKGLTSLVFM